MKNTKNHSKYATGITYAVLLFIVTAYIVPRLCGMPLLGAYANQTNPITMYTYHFVHVSVAHLILNMVACAGIVSVLRINGIFKLKDMVWSWLIASWVAPLATDTIPVMGLSAMLCTWLGIVWGYFVCAPYHLNKKMFLLFSINIAVSILIGFIHPGINGWLHLLAFLAGGLLSVLSACHKHIRLLLFCGAFFSLPSCSTLHKSNITEKTTVAESQQMTEQKETEEWKEYMKTTNSELVMKIDEIQFDPDTGDTTTPKIHKITRYDIRYAQKDTLKENNKTQHETYSTQNNSVNKNTDSHIITEEKKGYRPSASMIAISILTIIIIVIIIIIKL